ncbi:MAG TPA: carbohydrate ABC transporter permease [Candidatus Limiplasma stercoravium]|nr:carbohydrate ABC transporter permease [Candidatus Limiplasma stercoravium]
MQRSFIKPTIGGRLFDAFNYVFMVFLCVVMIYPLFYLAMMSLTASDVALTKGYLIPPHMSLENYAQVLGNYYIGYGFVNSIKRTVIGTALSVATMLLTAYPLSKKYFPNRRFWTAFVVFTMFFSGGMIPTYLTYSQTLHLDDSFWVMILPSLINTYNMLIARNFFMGLPEELSESGRIDGAGELRILVNIILPISLPIIATLSLWSAVSHWNAWFDSMLYFSDPKRQVLQLVLRRIVLEGSDDLMNLGGTADEMSTINPETIKAATTMVATIPIVLVYPFLQKYFVKGMVVGSLKG